MSWQPIQLPHSMGIGAGLDSLSANLGDLADFKAKQKARSDELAQQKLVNERQKGNDYQTALINAHKAAADGDHELAQSLLAPYTQGGFEQVAPKESAPGQFENMQSGMQNLAAGMGTMGGIFGGAMAMPLGQQPQQPQGGSAAAPIPNSAVPGMSDPEGDTRAPTTMDPARNAALAAKFKQMTGQGGPPQAMEPPPFAAASQPPQAAQEPPQGDAAPDMGAPPQAQAGQPQGPSGWEGLRQIALAEKQGNQDREKRLAEQMIRFRDYRGNEQTIDAQGTRDRQEAQKVAEEDRALEREATRAENAFAEVKDPKVMFHNLVKSGVGIDKASAMVDAEIRSRAKAEADAAAAVNKRTLDNQDFYAHNKLTSAQMDHRASMIAGRLAASKASEEAAKAAEKAKELEVPDIAGAPAGAAKRAPEAEKIRNAQAATRSALDTIEKLKTFTKENGTRLIPIVDADEIQRRDLMGGEIISTLTKMLETGTLQASEFNRYQKMIQPSIWQSTEGANKVLTDLASGLTNAYQNQLKSQGIHPKAKAPGPEDRLKRLHEAAAEMGGLE